MRNLTAALLLFGAAGALLPTVARDDPGSDARLRDALRAATLQVRALEDERSTAQARETALKKELEGLRAQQKSGGARAGDLAAQRRRLAEQGEANARLTEELSRCQAAARTDADAARTKEEERARLAGREAGLAERLAAAEARNERLYRLNKQIIDWLGQMGVGGALAAREPFLGLRRVELENLAQEYEDQALRERIRP
jgi:chromosome segregation ATPase